MRTAAVVLLALALAPPSVRAQGEPARPARLARADVGAFLGSFSVSDDDIDTFQHWSHSVFRSLLVPSSQLSLCDAVRVGEQLFR